MKKIGILGGTFDPIHYGHLLIAEHAFAQYMLDEVWIMPTGRSPHKEENQISDSEVRTNLIYCAIEDNPHMKLCCDEIESAEISYTYLTMTKFQEKYPENSFYFIHITTRIIC